MIYNSDPSIMFFITFNHPKIGARLLGTDHLEEIGIFEKFSEKILRDVTIDSLHTNSQELAIYVKDKANQKYILQIKKLYKRNFPGSVFSNKKISLIYMIKQSFIEIFPIEVTQSFISNLYSRSDSFRNVNNFIRDHNYELEIEMQSHVSSTEKIQNNPLIAYLKY